ncbi:MAG: hypothetical protein ACPG4W_04750 [Flavobacteriales bacterium]
MDLIFEDNTPFWKLVLISIISGLMLIHPFFKNEEPFSIDMILKKQKRTILFKRKYSSSLEIKHKIIRFLEENAYRISQVSPHQIDFKAKLSLPSIGIRYSIQFDENQLVIKSKLSSLYFPFDFNSLRYKTVKSIENQLNGLLG